MYQPPMPPPRVLLVEDDDSTSALLGELLADMGFAVDRLAEMEPAIVAARHSRPDLVVTDLWVSGDHRHAWQDVGRLRQAAEGVPFLLLTGHNDALEQGAQQGYRVLLKPFDVEVLEHAIRELMER
jgi:two-component system NtrC family sensor kinase